MFTGIIEEKGKVKRILKTRLGLRLSIEANRVLEGTQVGQSIAVDGVCLTAVLIKGHLFEADVMAETLKVTTLGKLRVGNEVNLERALRFSDRLGGHLVSGHVDSMGRIEAIRREGGSSAYEIALEKEILAKLIDKGSIAIDGISLTIQAIKKKGFIVSIIPHTLAITTLAAKKKGSLVNIEVDMMGKFARIEHKNKTLKGGN